MDREREQNERQWKKTALRRQANDQERSKRMKRARRSGQQERAARKRIA